MYIKRTEGGKLMKKIVTRIVEAYAKSTTTTSLLWYFHAPRAPKCLIK